MVANDVLASFAGSNSSGSVNCVNCDPIENWLACDSTNEMSVLKLSLMVVAGVNIGMEFLTVR